MPTIVCKAFQDCKSCHDVGTEATILRANAGAIVGTEGKRKDCNGNCSGDGAKASNRVGPVGNRNGKCSNDGLGNGISNSNGASFPDGDFPKLIASKIDVEHNLSESSHPILSDHEQSIDTFHELR